MERDIKFEVSERFHLIIEDILYNHLAKNYRDIEKQTGIVHQRLNDIKSYVTKGGRPSYPSLDNLYHLNRVFKVSCDWVILGVGEKFESNTPTDDQVYSELSIVKTGSNSILDQLNALKKEVAMIKKSVGL